MGCLYSKPEVDREASQRNQRIERGIKNDKKTLDRTIKILLLGGYPCNDRGSVITDKMNRSRRVREVHDY